MKIIATKHTYALKYSNLGRAYKSIDNLAQLSPVMVTVGNAAQYGYKILHRERSLETW